MKKHTYVLIAGMVLLFVSGTAWAGNLAGVTGDTPAILASLDRTGFVPLDDTAIEGVRGQAQYRMGKILGLNTWDFSLNWQVGWTFDLYQWRYGNYGGANWSGDPDDRPVDQMDTYFKLHDEGLPGEMLLAALAGLPNTPSSSWGGLIYSKGTEPWGPDPLHWFYGVYVSRTSVLSYGGTYRFFSFWKRMPLTEYARRQAYIAMDFLTAPPL